MSFGVSKALETVDEYLAEVNSLLWESYREGRDEKEALYTRLEHFISFTLPDGKERLASFRRSFPMRVSLSGHTETEDEKQEDYIEDLNTMRNNLMAFKEELRLKMSFDEKRDHTNNIERRALDEKSTAEGMFNDIITHPRIKQASQNHFKNEEYRAAVLDAMITLEVMIKEKAKYPKDNKGKELSGVTLMHKVFDSDKPILNWCKSGHQIEKDELEGYKLIFAGAMLGIRDPKAHAVFEIQPMRALKLLTLATLLAETVDASEYVKQDQRTDKT